jgi:tetratricopeptide (TPR) repeat protein
MNIKSQKTVLHCFLFFSLCFYACSSAPKRPAELTAVRSIADNQLILANQAAGRELYEDALVLLEEARRLALSVDDPGLRIRTAMSRGNILFSMGRADEAFPEWDSANAEAEASNEKELAALSRVYAIRARLTLLANTLPDAARNAAAEELKALLLREMAVFKSKSLSLASANVVLGMAEKLLGRWAVAEEEVMKAVKIHEKELFLEEAAYDWYLIASVRSMAGNYDTALEALRNSINFDRRAENGFGLAASWQAMGEVYRKAGRGEDARTAWRRAAEIFRALRREERAESLEDLY